MRQYNLRKVPGLLIMKALLIRKGDCVSLPGVLLSKAKQPSEHSKFAQLVWLPGSLAAQISCFISKGYIVYIRAWVMSCIVPKLLC